MTPSNPSPDTGAGTPPEDGSAMWRELYATLGEQWVRLLAAYDLAEDATADDITAARSRPATDPAGLDALLERIRTETREAVDEGDRQDCSSPDCIADAVYEIVRVVFRDARLSVADGPGPEERPDLERAARNLSDRRTLDSDGYWVSQKEMHALDRALAALPVEETGRS